MATTAKTPAAKKSTPAKKVAPKAKPAAKKASTGATIRKVAAAKNIKPTELMAQAEEKAVIGGFTHCPGCGTHLNNGVTVNGEEVNGKPLKLGHEFLCLGCGHEFGPSVKRKAPTKGMTGKKGTHLNPEAVKSKADALKAAAAKGRKRPVLAKKPDGSEVLCCSRTAKKNGWKLVERLFSRKAAPAPTPAAKRTTRLSKLEDMLK